MATSRKRTNPPSDNDDVTSGSQKKQKCKYGGNCYRKNVDHLNNFAHPGDTDNEGVGDKNKPLNDMDDGDTVDIDGYRIKKTSEHYYCTCPGWKIQKGPVNCRTCKHLKKHLGDEFETERMKQGGGKMPGDASKRKTDSPVKNPNARQPRHKNIPQPLLAQKYSDSIDPTGWWMSEKLDGVRAYWDKKTFYSRLGNEFVPPDWFIEGLPSDMELDGELFCGRKMFPTTVSIVKTAACDDWKKIKYHVFDAPGLGNQPFEKRMGYLNDYFTKNEVKYAEVVEQEKCKGKEQMEKCLDKVQKMGGEGLMLREPKSKYENCRSHTLLKVKTFYDAEAIVIGHEQGKGRNSHRCGALRCKMESGKLFSVGSGLTDAQRNKPPKKGSIIVYKFQELTKDGVPRFPTFLGEAADKTKAKDAVLPEIEVQ